MFTEWNYEGVLEPHCWPPTDLILLPLSGCVTLGDGLIYLSPASSLGSTSISWGYSMNSGRHQAGDLYPGGITIGVSVYAPLVADTGIWGSESLSFQLLIGRVILGRWLMSQRLYFPISEMVLTPPTGMQHPSPRVFCSRHAVGTQTFLNEGTNGPGRRNTTTFLPPSSPPLPPASRAFSPPSAD